MEQSTPTYDADLFTDDAIRDPYEHYRAIRDLAPAVWLPRHDVYAVGRYDSVRDVLGRAEVFVSGEGVGFEDEANRLSRGKTLTSDDPLHAHLRKVVAHRLLPRALKELDDTIDSTAQKVIGSLPHGEHAPVEGMSSLARAVPMAVVPEFLGLPDECRPHLLPWAGATIDTLGPTGPRTEHNLGLRRELMAYAGELVRDRALAAGSVGADLLTAADRGDLSLDQCPALMIDYLGPSLETTVAAIGSALGLFAQNPDQWDLLRADPGLVPGAFAETVRLESPLRGFTRLAVEDTEIDGVSIASGSRLWVLYASANRDERKWDTPTRFDITRRNLDQVAFGYGIHSCPGQGLARKEFSALFTRLASRFAHVTLAGEPQWVLNNILRCYGELPLSFEEGA